VLLFFMRSNVQGNKFRVQISIHVLMDRRAANWELGERTTQSQNTENGPGGEQKNNLADGSHKTGKTEQRSSGRTEQHRSAHDLPEPAGNEITEQGLDATKTNQQKKKKQIFLSGCAGRTTV
jgi:hypothetical protein